MDKLIYYRDTIIKLLQGYYNLTKHCQEDSVRDYLALDGERDCFLWFCSGWEGKKRVQYFIVYLRLENGKIWVEEDNTNLCIVDDLLRANIPKEDIVLGFHHPSKRKFTEFSSSGV